MVILLWVIVTNMMGACSPEIEGVPIEDAEEQVMGVNRLPGRRAEVMYGGRIPGREDIHFDPNSYFDVFDELSMQPGFTLDFVYLNDGLGAKPVVYAYPIEEGPLRNYEEYLSWKQIQHPGSFAVIEGSNDYLEHVVIEDTPEGYFQYVALAIMEDQFCLYWHALYNDTRIITSAERAGSAFNRFARDTEGITSKLYLRSVRRVSEGIGDLDYTPTVEMKEKTAIVRMIVFSEWGGFSELRVEVSRAFPHEILNWKEKTRLYFNSGVMF
jgi:hypothetical protein